MEEEIRTKKYEDEDHKENMGVKVKEFITYLEITRLDSNLDYKEDPVENSDCDNQYEVNTENIIFTDEEKNRDDLKWGAKEKPLDTNIDDENSLENALNEIKNALKNFKQSLNESIQTDRSSKNRANDSTEDASDIVEISTNENVCKVPKKRIKQGKRENNIKIPEIPKIDLYCKLCEVRFKKEKPMEDHKVFCKVWYEYLKKNQISSASVDNLTCRFCGHKYKCKRLKLEHECIHTGEKLYKCEFCEKRYRTREYYMLHMNTHTKSKQYKCDKCDMIIKDKRNYKVHLRRHNGERPFKCEYCDKCFVLKSERANHQMVHTRKRPFKCEECGKLVATKFNYLVHLRKHTSERPFKCNECDRNFFTSGSLKEHIRAVHSNEQYICEICGTEFSSEAYLKRHLKRHTIS